MHLIYLFIYFDLGTGYVDYVVNFGYPYSSEIFKKRMECAKRFCPDASINTIFEKTLKAGEFIQYLNDTDQKIPPALMNLYKTFSQGIFTFLFSSSSKIQIHPADTKFVSHAHE